MTTSIATLAGHHARLVAKLRRLSPLDERAAEILADAGKAGRLWALGPHVEVAREGRPTVSEGHLAQVEARLGFPVPGQYREYLQTVACGGLAGEVPINDFPGDGRPGDFEVCDFPELKRYDLHDPNLSDAWWDEREGGVGFTLWEFSGNEAWIVFGGNHPGSIWTYDSYTGIHTPREESFAEYVTGFILSYEKLADLLLANLPA